MVNDMTNVIPSEILPLLTAYPHTEWYLRAGEDWYGPCPTPEAAIADARTIIPDEDIDDWDIEIGVRADAIAHARHFQKLIKLGVDRRAAFDAIQGLKESYEELVWKPGSMFNDQFAPDLVQMYEVDEQWGISLYHPLGVPMKPVGAAR